jgi:hypothetical protein
MDKIYSSKTIITTQNTFMLKLEKKLHPTNFDVLLWISLVLRKAMT